MRKLKFLSLTLLLLITILTTIQVTYAAPALLPDGVTVSQGGTGFTFDKDINDYYFTSNGVNQFIIPSQLAGLATDGSRTITVSSTTAYYGRIEFIIGSTTYGYNINSFHSFVLTRETFAGSTSYEVDIRMKEITTGNPISIFTTTIEHSTFGVTDFKIRLKYSTSADSIPLMEGGTYIANVSDPKTLTQIRTEINLQAIDAHEGNISHAIQVYDDNYTGNETTIGIYDVVFYVEDSSGNGVYATIVIIVMDLTAPTIPGTQTVSKRYDEVFDYETYIANLTITDNHDAYEDLTITIESNTYVGNEDVVGYYQIVYRVEDISENYVTGIINVDVYDDVIPVITGPSTLSRDQSQSLTIQDIVDRYTAADAYDGDITGDIYVHYNGYSVYSVPGTYNVVLRVQDSSGNVGSKSINVTITDSVPPVFYVENNGKIIHVSALMSLSEANIISILVSRGFINLTPQSITLFEVNNYTMNVSTSGTYAMMLRIYDDESYETSRTYSFAMIVYGGDDEPVVPPIHVDEEPWYMTQEAMIGGGIFLFIFIVFFFRKRR